MLERRLDADDLGVRLAVDRARITIESIATDAGAGATRLAVVFVEQHGERQRERMMALPLQGIMEFLDARLVRDRRWGRKGGGRGGGGGGPPLGTAPREGGGVGPDRDRKILPQRGQP